MRSKPQKWRCSLANLGIWAKDRGYQSLMMLRICGFYRTRSGKIPLESGTILQACPLAQNGRWLAEWLNCFAWNGTRRISPLSYVCPMVFLWFFHCFSWFSHEMFPWPIPRNWLKPRRAAGMLCHGFSFTKVGDVNIQTMVLLTGNGRFRDFYCHFQGMNQQKQFNHS